MFSAGTGGIAAHVLIQHLQGRARCAAMERARISFHSSPRRQGRSMKVFVESTSGSAGRASALHQHVAELIDQAAAAPPPGQGTARKQVLVLGFEPVVGEVLVRQAQGAGRSPAQRPAASGGVPAAGSDATWRLSKRCQRVGP